MIVEQFNQTLSHDAGSAQDADRYLAIEHTGVW
jgi:hypothetical protein